MVIPSRALPAIAFFAAAGLSASGCASLTRTVPPALDPANPQAEESPASTQLTPLVPPGPSNAAFSGADNSMIGSARPGHDMAAMSKPESEPSADQKAPASPSGGRDMAAAMKPASTADMAAPHAGHDMATMKNPEPQPGADNARPPPGGRDMAAMKPASTADMAAPHAGHDMAAMKKPESEPRNDKASPPAGNDMGGMKMPGDESAPPGGEEHLKGVVTKVTGGSIVVKLEASSTAVVVISGRTEFERGDAKANLKDVRIGERIVIYASKKDGKWLARVVKLSTAPPSAGDPHSGSSADKDVKAPIAAQEYTCPMHPEVRSSTPGRCPKCGMKLEPVGSK